MSHKKMIYGVFNDPDVVISAVKTMRKQGIKIFDVFTPFAVHGLDKAMGIKRSRLAIVAFICGSIGFTLALLLQVYTSHWDWPMNVGGKPSLSIPTYVPVCFEFTVLCTGFGMSLTFFARARMLHGVRADVLSLRQTDDLFVLAIDADKPNINKDQINKLLMTTGAIEIRERELSI